MITVETDGTTADVQVGRELTRDEIAAALGAGAGGWRIDGVANDHYCLSLGWGGGREVNATASRMLGKAVWGRAVFLRRGHELR